MSLLVIDASVAAKWLLPAAQEQFVEPANDLLAREARGSFDFIVPDLFWPELGNILWKAASRRRVTAEYAATSLATAQEWAFETVPSGQLLNRALKIGLEHSRSFYDSLYLALAVTRGATLITADERLANAVAAYLPVKWLGAL